MKRSIKIGEHNIRLWLVVVLLISVICIGVLADYVWRTIFISVEIKEPLEIVSYPSKLSLYPGETEEFNVTIMNHASRNYTVVLDFSLDNETYQNLYVTFSDQTYTVISGQQDLLAGLKVEPYAPPINTSLTIDLLRIEEELLFFDDFNDGVADGWTEHLGTWNVIDGEYFVTVGFVENGISTVNGLNLTDCIIEAKLRFKDTEVGFRAGIVFGYTGIDTYFSLEPSNEYDTIHLLRYTPEHSDYGEGVVLGVDYPIQSNVNYLLRIVIRGNNFRGFINGQEVVSGTDENYLGGMVGLRARSADAFFDDFKVTKIS